MTRSISREQQVLFVYNASVSFVLMDRDLLRERWDVQERYERSRRINPFSLAWAVWRSDLVFCWFASWHSFWPVMFARWFGKPSVVVIGGYDTANLPEAGYGSQRGGLPRWVVNTLIRHATRLIAISNSAQQEAIRNTNVEPRKISVIYPGLEAALPIVLSHRDALVLTVGGVWRENLLRKGLLPFVKTAAYFPELQFVVAGRWHDDSINELKRVARANVTFKGHLADDDLAALYNRAAVYVQASLHEGFGLSVAEAMLAGCAPVVTRVGALPEVVGEAGVYARSNQPGDLAAAIREALSRQEELRPAAQRRIAENFPMALRRQKLHALIEELLSPDSAL